jgi:hypothetical protein
VNGTRRSSTSSRRPPGASSSSAPLIRRAVASRAAPAPVVVEASVLARLLGVRLLTLRATVVLHPADALTSPPPDRPARPFAVAPARSGPGRAGLADARQSITEGAELLADARRHA